MLLLLFTNSFLFAYFVHLSFHSLCIEILQCKHFLNFLDLRSNPFHLNSLLFHRKNLNLFTLYSVVGLKCNTPKKIDSVLMSVVLSFLRQLPKFLHFYASTATTWKSVFAVDDCGCMSAVKSVNYVLHIYSTFSDQQKKKDSKFLEQVRLVDRQRCVLVISTALHLKMNPRVYVQCSEKVTKETNKRKEK